MRLCRCLITDWVIKDAKFAKVSPFKELLDNKKYLKKKDKEGERQER